MFITVNYVLTPFSHEQFSPTLLYDRSQEQANTKTGFLLREFHWEDSLETTSFRPDCLLVPRVQTTMPAGRFGHSVIQSERVIG